MTDPASETAVTCTGAGGSAVGLIGAAVEGTDVPCEFVAVTLNLYGTPLASPMTSHCNVADVEHRFFDGDATTV